MGYIAVIVTFLIVVPLLFLLMGRRPTSAGGARGDHGVTPSEPAADAPTPRADAVNQVAPGAERRLPPG
jgi:hypothetical protein